MKINFTKTSHILFFVILIPILSVILVFLLNLLLKPFVHHNYFFLIDSIGGIGTYGFLYARFDKFFWRWKIFRTLKIVDFSNLSGRWKGKLLSSFDGKKESIPVVLEIKQTFSNIHLYMYFEKSTSVSITADFILERDGAIGLHYEYQNDPNESAAQTMHIHYGTAKLVYFEDKNVLKGEYYNPNRHDRGHIGSLDFKFESKDMIRRFND